MFRGATKITLDAKGRMAFPTRYRERLMTRADGHLVATVDRDYCLLIYPLPDWEEIERKLVRLPALNKQARRLQRLMVGYATELDLDGHGRILLPKELREFAGLERQAMLIGQGTSSSYGAKNDGALAGTSGWLTTRANRRAYLKNSKRYLSRARSV